MPYLALIARLYHEIEATSCQAELNFLALAHLIGDLRSRMLVSKVERTMFIRLNRHLIDEVRELDTTVAQALTRVAKSVRRHPWRRRRRGRTCRLTLPRMVMWIVSLVRLPSFCLFSAFFFCVLCCSFRGYNKILMAFDFCLSFVIHEAAHIHSR